MKLRNIVLPVLVLALIMYGCGNNLLEFMADKDSKEAVEFDTAVVEGEA